MTKAQIVWTVIGAALALMATSSSAAWIVSRTIAETVAESEERLRLEIRTGIQTVNQRIDAVNQRIDAVNQRIDTLLLDRER